MCTLYHVHMICFPSVTFLLIKITHGVITHGILNYIREIILSVASNVGYYLGAQRRNRQGIVAGAVTRRVKVESMSVRCRRIPSTSGQCQRSGVKYWRVIIYQSTINMRQAKWKGEQGGSAERGREMRE